MGIFDFLFGSKDKLQQMPTLAPEQNTLLNHLVSRLGGMGDTGQVSQLATSRLSDLLQGGSEAYDRFAAPYMSQFQNEILPKLSERFAGMGALGSSAFGQSIGAAGAGLQENLAALRANQQQQGIQTGLSNYANQLGIGLNTQPFGYQMNRGSAGFIPQALGAGFGGLASGGYGALSRLFGFGGQ